MSQTKRAQNEILDAAFAALGRGWPVFPISIESKNPMVKWARFQSELPSRVKVSNWFDSDYKGQANLGLATGELARVVVLDCDDAVGLEEIERRGGLPQTVMVQTRPDIAHKLHFYFEHPGFECRNFAKKFKIGEEETIELPGLDFRGDGGYVMLPPSQHWSGAGQYEWLRSPDEFPIAPLPEWLGELLWQRHQADSAPRPAVEPVPLPLDASGDRARKWALGALQKERDKMLSEPDGSKHERRLKSAIALGGIAEHGLLTDAEIFDALAVNFGKERKGAEQTIRDGIKIGRGKPRALPSFEDRRARPARSVAPADASHEEAVGRSTTRVRWRSAMSHEKPRRSFMSPAWCEATIVMPITTASNIRPMGPMEGPSVRVSTWSTPRKPAGRATYLPTRATPIRPPTTCPKPPTNCAKARSTCG